MAGQAALACEGLPINEATWIRGAQIGTNSMHCYYLVCGPSLIVAWEDTGDVIAYSAAGLETFKSTHWHVCRKGI